MAKVGSFHILRCLLRRNGVFVDVERLRKPEKHKWLGQSIPTDAIRVAGSVVVRAQRVVQVVGWVVGVRV